MMLKQLQELQRQQQLQQLGDARQQNSLNQLSAIAKATGAQFSPLINGTPVHDSSQMFMNRLQRDVSPTAQGVSNRVLFSQEQVQAMRSMGMVPQQLDTSLYGTPISSARGNMSQYSHLGGISHDTANLLTKAGGQAQKPVMQSSGFSNSYARDQSALPPDQVCMPQRTFTSNQGFAGKNMAGPVSVHGFNNRIITNNLQEGNPQMYVSFKEFNGRQEQAAWPAMQQNTEQVAPPEGLIPLDPIEEKILYNMDDNIWDPSFGSRPDLTAGGFGSTLEGSDLSNTLPSLQSGSWSALMQSAVAEASSSDTGIQEEWSGLTFQTTEQSTDNQMSNFMDSDKQQTGWADNNLQSASSSNSKPAPIFSDSSMNSSFPGFQQPGIQLSSHREGQRQDSSHEAVEKSSKDAGKWLVGNAQQKSSIEGNQQVQSFIHMDNAWAGQIYGHSESDGQQQKLTLNNNVSQLHSKGEVNEVLYKRRDTDDCLWKTNANYGVSSFSRSTGEVEQVHSTVHNREDASAAEVCQSTSQQVPSSIQPDYIECFDIHMEKKAKESMGYNQHHINNSPQDFCNSYGGAEKTYEKRQNFNKGCLPDFPGTSKASEDTPPRCDLRSVGSDVSNVTGQTSQNKLELFHNVDKLREDGTVMHFGSTDCNALADVPGPETHTSAQLYDQSSASQGFGLRLAPPSQRLPNSNNFLTLQDTSQTLSSNNPRQVNSELREKSQTWVAPTTSVQSSSPLPELSQRAHLGLAGISSNLNPLGSSVGAFASSPSYIRNQPQMQVVSKAPVASQFAQAALPGTFSRVPPFNLVSSQDTSRQISINPFRQQFSVLESVPVSQPSVMSGMSQQGDFLARPHNVWTNVPIQQYPSGLEPLKVPSNLTSSLVSSNNTMLNSSIGECQSSVIGARSMSSLGLDFIGEEQPGKANSQQQMTSQIHDTSQTAVSSRGQELSTKHSSDANALSAGSLVAHSDQQYLDVLRHNDNHAPAVTERNIESFIHSMKSSHNFHQNYSLLHQVQAMDKEPKSASQLNSFPSRDARLLSILAQAREDPGSSKGMIIFTHNESQSQSSSSNMAFNHTEHGQVNLQMAPNWFKQYGTLKNGQMIPVYAARLAKAAAAQFSLGNPCHTSMNEGDAADPSQSDMVKTSASVTLVKSEQLTGPYVLTSDAIHQDMAIRRPKKRKTATSEPLPWHKEVAQGSQRLQDISMAEQDWAQATNRLIEKVDYDIETLEDMQPMIRSKRRVILTRQLMQQLLCPAPASIFSGDATSHYDSVSYFISRLALGDACSLTYYTRNDLPLLLENGNMISEKLKTNGQQFLEVVEEFIGRVKKLEDEFQRSDKTATILDIRVECQELERDMSQPFQCQGCCLRGHNVFHCNYQLVDPAPTESLFCICLYSISHPHVYQRSKLHVGERKKRCSRWNVAQVNPEEMMQLI
ncbi:hypothetical protein CFOL_v3_09205 [Cephalotus follicularis]|uniref:Uncharacterized protein n=1 Tax=Cephalotus follicularis TaxID=3775 RepID=A0A1Q3BCF0_CEPFO|nr:hypothetical protein CFOL_v3_09205 [Cephalotus follicularis]